jgi:hypothetical protein
MDPRDSQLRALKQIVCHLLVRDYRELIAYGAGWTDPERQQPVGDTGRHEPSGLDAIADAELQRALGDPDPLRGIAQLTARWAAANVLDPAGVTRTKALGSERMARKLRDALPGGDGALRAAVWEFMRPMLSPALVALNRDAFVLDERIETTVDLEAHRASSDLDELALDEEPDAKPRNPILIFPPSSRPSTKLSAGGPAGPGNARTLFFCPQGRSSAFGSRHDPDDARVTPTIVTASASGSSNVLATEPPRLLERDGQIQSPGRGDEGSIVVFLRSPPFLTARVSLRFPCRILWRAEALPRLLRGRQRGVRGGLCNGGPGRVDSRASGSGLTTWWVGVRGFGLWDMTAAR